MAVTPKHEHVWYPISYTLEEDLDGTFYKGDPVLWACGVHRSCIQTLGLKRTGRKPYVYTQPQPQMEPPTGQ